MAKVSKKQYLIEDTVIIDQIYPLVEATMSSKCSALKSCIERFIHSRQASLYDYAPVDRIFFKKSDVNDFFKSINVNQKTVTNILPQLYYWKDDELQACKDEFSLTALMALRYLAIKKIKSLLNYVLYIFLSLVNSMHHAIINYGLIACLIEKLWIMLSIICYHKNMILLNRRVYLELLEV